MNIIFVSTSEIRYDVSNASRFLYISNELNKLGIDSIIIGSYSQNNVKMSNIIGVKPLSNNLIGRILLRIQIPYTALKHMMKNQSKYCIVRGFDMPIAAIFIKFLGKKMLYDFHGYRFKEEVFERKQYRAKITKIFDILMIILADNILAVSEGICRELPKKYRKKAIVVPNGVDPDLFKHNLSKEEKNDLMKKYGIEKGKIIVGFVGHWEQWMKVEDIINARDYLPDIQILIVGRGHNFEQLSNKYGHVPSIIFTGSVQHELAIKLIDIMDICVIPYANNSIHANKNGFYSSRKTKEYILLNKPIITSNVNTRESFLKNMENTLLYNVGHPEDLAEKIRTLEKDGSLRAKIQHNNLKMSQKFTWTNVVNKSGLIDIIKL